MDSDARGECTVAMVARSSRPEENDNAETQRALRDAEGLWRVASGGLVGKNGGHRAGYRLSFIWGEFFTHSNCKDGHGVPCSYGTFRMDNFEEIGRRIDAEMERLRRYVDEELGPETEKRTASFLRDVSGKLDQFAQKLEARMARRSPSSPSTQTSPPQGNPHS